MRWHSVALLILALPLLGASEPAEGESNPLVAADRAAREALEIEARQSALRLLEEDLTRQLKQLLATREALEAALAREQAGPETDLSTLISFYSAMKPKNAALLLEKLPTTLSAEVLGEMNPRAAGKILNVMKPDRAVRISKLMAGNER